MNHSNPQNQMVQPFNFQFQMWSPQNQTQHPPGLFFSQFDMMNEQLNSNLQNMHNMLNFIPMTAHNVNNGHDNDNAWFE